MSVEWVDSLVFVEGKADSYRKKICRVIRDRSLFIAWRWGGGGRGILGGSTWFFGEQKGGLVVTENPKGAIAENLGRIQRGNHSNLFGKWRHRGGSRKSSNVTSRGDHFSDGTLKGGIGWISPCLAPNPPPPPPSPAINSERSLIISMGKPEIPVAPVGKSNGSRRHSVWCKVNPPFLNLVCSAVFNMYFEAAVLTPHQIL